MARQRKRMTGPEEHQAMFNILGYAGKRNKQADYTKIRDDDGRLLGVHFKSIAEYGVLVWFLEDGNYVMAQTRTLPDGTRQQRDVQGVLTADASRVFSELEDVFYSRLP